VPDIEPESSMIASMFLASVQFGIFAAEPSGEAAAPPLVIMPSATSAASASPAGIHFSLAVIPSPSVAGPPARCAATPGNCQGEPNARRAVRE
jgi:hypothetical protein